MRTAQSALALLTALSAVAPGLACSTEPRGELVVVVQTDMSLPKDIDTIRIEVLVYGAPKHDEYYEKIGTDEGSILLPATLGLLVPDDPSTPVTVRVTARRGGRDGEVRVLREVVTTVPPDRIAMLPIPIQFLCDGSAKEEGGRVVTTCENAEDTCIAGECAPKAIAAAQLANLSPEPASDVDDSAGGAPEDCFDVATCFESGAPAELDLVSCTLVPNGDVNVALASEGEGICGATGCFIAVDAESPIGWTTTDDGRIELPAKVCEWVESGKLLGVVTSPVTQACQKKKSDLPTCGAWSSASAQKGEPKEPVPVVIAGGQAHPVALVLRGGKVYWTNGGTFGMSDGTVKRVAHEGGKPAVIASAQAWPRDITADDTHVFWTNGGAGTPGTGSLMQAALGSAGGTELTGGLSWPEGVVADSSNLYYTEPGSSDISIFSIGLNEKQKFQVGNYPYRVAKGTKNLYWVNEGTLNSDPPDGSVVRAGLNVIQGEVPPPQVLADKQGTPRALALDYDSSGGEIAVYWANFSVFGGLGEIVRLSLSDSTITVLASGEDSPNGIAVDADNVYWTTRGEGAVKMLSKSSQAGDAPIVLATGQRKPGAVAIDENAIYWINEGVWDKADGAVMRLAKGK
jgi:hypothetical protein